MDSGKLSEEMSAGVIDSDGADQLSHQPPRPRTGTETLSGQQDGQAGQDQPRREQAKLAFASFLMLFVELALIRWVTANNVYVTNATNFVLLASFLGIGIGFLNARSGRDYLRWTPVALLALVAFVLAFPVILASLSGTHPFQGLQGMPALPRPVSLTIVFLLSTAVMAGIGQGVARLFVRFRPLAAYRLDILGSIAGIAVFSGLSFLDQPPFTWGVIATGGLLALLAPKVRWWQVGAVAVIVVLLGVESFVPDQMWSPYNKLSVIHNTRSRTIQVSANNIPYQTARPLSVMHLKQPFYFFPYRHVSRASLGNVLIIGAGNGNDVAVALAEGARHVDAVEIDPLLLHRIGAEHPDHPYASPRVTEHVGDGRAFLQNTSQHYNLIVLALPDSLTALAGQSAIRLESYLLTQQSLAAAKAHLAPGGTFVMYNYYAPFLLNRYATTIEDVFHKAPCTELARKLGGRQMGVLTVRPGGTVPNCQAFWHGPRVAPATDDHPFPYLPQPVIPNSYLLMLGAILLGSLLLVRVAGGSLRPMGRYVDLAFMGAAFMLLETKNIVQFALLFGTTWLVNSLVFAGVLIAVYLAVETANRVRLPRPAPLYVALIATLALAWVVPQASLLALPMVPRFLAGAALAFAPIYLANLIFAQRFAGVETAGAAFAANLLGAMAGGTLEYISLATGYRVLLILVGVLYAAAFASGLRKRVVPGSA